MVKVIHIVVSALLLCTSSAPALTVERAREFIMELAAGSDSLDRWHHPDELARSRRLGIEYEGVAWKFLLGYDLEPDTRRLVLDSEKNWNVEVIDAGGGWAVAHLKVLNRPLDRAFYFKDDLFVTPVYYFTRDFEHRESRFYSFLIQEPATFHPASAAALDEFVVRTASELGLGAEELKLLEREKIIYVLCRDQQAIKQLSGYEIRGMGVVSHDYVVTTYSTHCHEVVHLLAALKLGRVQPVTHPLLREGLAVALGGRGGRDVPVMLDVGYFLFRSPLDESDQLTTLVNLDSLCDERAYLEEAVSFSYPASGLYVRFLLDLMELDTFLALYRKYSHPDGDTASCVISTAELPPREAWEKYLEGWRQFTAVQLVGTPPDYGRKIVELSGATVWDCGDKYCFRLEGGLTFSESPPPMDYRSSRFEELLPDKAYPGCRYLVSTLDGEIGIYDLYLNTLLANRVPSFTYPPEEESPAGPVTFTVEKAVFALPLTDLTPGTLE